MSHPVFKKKLLASCVAAACSASMSMVAQAQDGVDEEVVVFGIRGSLEQAADIKREATGVVDAISAEDIGKFPDTNLAESLQRITGVSIDRRNGEGASVTIRGFEGNNNMVVLNGRQMPTADAFGGGSGAGGTFGGATRSFNFANLASEAVSGIEVYKTTRADVASGGIGGTINIKTVRPLDRAGYAVVGAKLVNDTTNRVGEDFTPELSGLVSWTDDNETFGVSLAAIFQERDSGAAGAALNNWNIGTWDGGVTNLYSLAPTGEIENEPEIGQLYARPNDVRLSYSDRHRERTNAQLTGQFRPQDDLTLTADFTFAEVELEEQRGEQTFWFNNNGNARLVQFDDSPVATPVIYLETGLTNKDNGYEQQYRQQTNTLESFGFNADWQLTDSFNLAFDAHNSTMESLPTGPAGSGEIAISVAAPVHASQRANFSRDIPTVATTINDPLGNNNNRMDIADFGTQVGRIWEAAQESDINQVRIDASLALGDTSSFDFGIDSRAVESHSWASNRFMTFGNWSVGDAGAFNSGAGQGLIQEFNLGQQFDDYGYMADASQQQQFGIRGDARDIMQFVVDRGQAGLYPGQDVNQYEFALADARTADNMVEEDITALYFQVSMGGELGGLATHLTAGLRYEDTDVKSHSLVQVPDFLRWEDNNDFQLIFTDIQTPITLNSNYDNMLPSFDFDVELSDELKGRFSYGKSISRAGYGNLTAVASNFGTTGSTLLGSIPGATQSNPGLVPLESDNVDVSLEWYYDDASFASIGLFEKRVSNFIGTEQITSGWFGLRDQTAGPRAQAALAQLAADGILVSDTSLFVMMAVMENPNDPYQDTVTDPTNQDYFAGVEQYTDFNDIATTYTNPDGTIDSDFAGYIARGYDLVPNSTDPLMEFSTDTPTNNREAQFSGAEFAVQHFFGETGFGVQFNYTAVNSDTSFDDLGDPSASQFALTGLSDTYNLVGIYENSGWSARVAYNWRDEFLAQTNVGGSNNPRYVEEYTQLDLNVAYDVSDALTVFFEGINLTEEDVRQFARTESQLWFLDDLGARYQIGARYTFE